MPSRFLITDVPGDPSIIEKRGDPAAIAREAAALGILAGLPWVPALAQAGPGWMRSGRLPGAPRPLAGVDAGGARRLGTLLREVHDRRCAGSGGMWWWDAPAATLAEYRHRRAADSEHMLAGGPDAGLALSFAVGTGGASDADEPFRMLHGDLVEDNIVWGPGGPGLVDWEFWRMGDPAEDLAYLIELNDIPARPAAALIDGYALAGMARRVQDWRALVAIDAGAWYLAHGEPERGARLLARGRAAA